jgi:carboxyl-terminal processing protease
MHFLKIKVLALVVIFAAPFFSFAADTNAPARFATDPEDGRIAYLTARLLEEYHYSQQPLDAEMSAKFFDSYVESLDPRHETFLQADLAEFDHYRTNLDKLTIGSRGVADLTPANDIFRRFLERFGQHTAYVDDLLRQDKFKFNTDENFLLDRRHAPYPKTLDEAKQLWRQQLRYEYLQEKLSREISPTNSVILSPLNKTNFTEITDTLARRYNWTLHMVTNWDSDNVLQAYLEALTHAYDPHSDYLNAPHAQDFSINMSLSLFGIGATLTEDYGYCTISQLIPGGPAAKSKQLNEKDRIVAVAQAGSPPVDVVDMELDKVVQLIRGPKATVVRLTISPADDRALRRVVTLVRDEINLADSEAKARLIETPAGRGETNRFGVIDLPSFYATIPMSGNAGHSMPKFVSDDVEKLIKKLKQEKVGGIILDLRGNPGGSLEEAVKFTGLFIKDGPVVLTRNLDGQVTVDADPDSSQLYDGPLVVLINRLSASASEIVAAALQDYGRALIVGDISTFGKGTVQNLNPLRPYFSTATNDPGTLKITIHKFYRVSGASTQLRGVNSDIVLPDVLNYSTQYGESALDNPLPWDTIPSVGYNRLNLVRPYLDQLRPLSYARVATNRDFAYVRQDIEQYQKMQLDKTSTLNERDAIKEWQTNQARQKARAADRDARPLPNEKIYDLTVENSDKPGLPPPTPLTTTNYGIVSGSNNFAGYFKSNNIASSKINIVATNGLPVISNALAADPTLDEAERILQDYISLLTKNSTLIANH